MSTSALLLMVLVQGSVAAATIYFFLKVLKAPVRHADEESTKHEDRAE
jgi:heme/copper-type cytochrome/quinol oxidase subunit 2